MKTAVDAATGGYPFLPIVYKRFLNGYKGVCDSAIKGLIRHWEWRKEVFIVYNNSFLNTTYGCPVLLLWKSFSLLQYINK